MLRDIENGAPIEAEHVIGDLYGRGCTHGLTSPLLRIVYAHVCVYEERRRRIGNAVN